MFLSYIVELTGFEPVTPTLPVWCATSCAIAPQTRCNPVGCNSLKYTWRVFNSPNRLLLSDDLYPVTQVLAGLLILF